MADTRGRVVSAAFNPTGYLTRLTDVGGRYQDFTYGSSTITDAAGKVTTFDVTGSGMRKITDLEGNQTTFVLDGNGRVTSLKRVTNRVAVMFTAVMGSLAVRASVLDRGAIVAGSTSLIVFVVTHPLFMRGR